MFHFTLASLVRAALAAAAIALFASHAAWAAQDAPKAGQATGSFHAADQVSRAAAGGETIA